MTPRTVPFLLAAVFAGVPSPCPAQDSAPGWQDQRTIALQAPGRSMTGLRLLSRNHDTGRRDSGAELRLTRDVTLREGRAMLFEARSDDFPLAKFSGALDGKGIHLMMTWPP